MTLPKRALAVLVVEDHDDTRDLYAEYLTCSGLQVSTARDGLEALQKVRNEQPDVVVIDLSLPALDGCEVTRLLKADPTTNRIHIVVLTGFAGPESVARAREAGCDAFVAKPCGPEHLLAEVLKYEAAAS